MSEPPRVTCTHCRADLGEATIRAFRDQHGRTDWRWDLTAAEYDCPGPAPTPKEAPAS
jgi:hypothetical protein